VAGSEARGKSGLPLGSARVMESTFEQRRTGLFVAADFSYLASSAVDSQ